VAASDIDAAKLQVITTCDLASATWAFQQAVARARGSADRLLGSSRHALDASDPVTSQWKDVTPAVDWPFDYSMGWGSAVRLPEANPSVGRGGVPRSPDPQLAKHRSQVPARSGQHVFVARRMLAVAAPFDEPRIFESAKPRRQAGPGCAGVDADVVELGDPKTELAQRKQRPLVPDELQRIGYRAHPRPSAVEYIF
jgi:hypothetical protein